MKTKLLLSLALFLGNYSMILGQCVPPADKTCIEDDQFEAYLESAGLGDDIPNNDLVFTSRIQVVTDLDVSAQGIKSMNGIEAFTALQNLNCSSNNLLTSLNVFNNTSITELRIFNCSINNLTLPNNNTLTYLSCGNNNLPGLDVSGYPNLTYLACANNLNGDLGVMDLKPNTKLITLYLHNSGVTSLDISTCTDLDLLHCFTTNEFSNANNLSTLDISANTKLREVRCYNIGLNTIIYSASPYNNMTFIDCGSNNLNSLELAKFPNIETLWCYYNNLSSLDFSNNILLQSLDFGGNSGLTNINLSMLANLVTVWGYDTLNLNSLTLPTNSTTLENIWFFQNGLSTLDFTTNTGLQRMDIAGGNFSDIDVSMLTNLTQLYCNKSNLLTSLNIANGNIDSFDWMWADENPLLDCIQVDDETKAYGKSQPNWKRDFDTEFSLNCSLSVDEFLKESISLYPNPTKNKVFLETVLSVSYNLLNIQGQEMFKGHFSIGMNEMDLSNLPQGLYFLNLESPDGSHVKKILKN
ncbi:T9SS type A sorting domain-containing protein [Seonamhaeicola sediminis]|uniref:T9SS type A sorting domain-containing protein n=1 Tax=Seonamhaeicola sediminis TaxID=2528206 RepID=A0A562YBT3_9FLAO|nr:T9SS type A sorting domain-containing protein [Seonamhaeicola sediminis]TWO31883.1 T9SS type A sorting domain-containing protein [Seonamhaeicola sediminis]